MKSLVSIKRPFQDKPGRLFVPRDPALSRGPGWRREAVYREDEHVACDSTVNTSPPNKQDEGPRPCAPRLAIRSVTVSPALCVQASLQSSALQAAASDRPHWVGSWRPSYSREASMGWTEGPGYVCTLLLPSQALSLLGMDGKERQAAHSQSGGGPRPLQTAVV